VRCGNGTVPYRTTEYGAVLDTVRYVAHARAVGYGTARWYGTVRYRTVPYKYRTGARKPSCQPYGTVPYCTLYAYPTVRSDVILTLLSLVFPPRPSSLS